MKNQSLAYTLVEIVITIFIAASLFAMGVFTLQTYLPKQRLLDSMETIEQTLNRAQFEATSRSTWSCIKYDTATKILTVYMDTNLNHTSGPTGCGDGTDMLITNQSLKDGVGFPNPVCSNGGNSSYDSVTDGPIWFDSTGIPKSCAGGVCTTTSFQVFVTSANLPASNKAREIEAVSSGLISIVERNSPGYITTLFAKTADQNGAGECE